MDTSLSQYQEPNSVRLPTGAGSAMEETSRANVEAMDPDTTIAADDTLTTIPPSDLGHSKKISVSFSSSSDKAPNTHQDTARTAQNNLGTADARQTSPQLGETDLTDTGPLDISNDDFAQEKTFVADSTDAEHTFSKPRNDASPYEATTQSPRSYPRPHNLELNLKPPSPQPWDIPETHFEPTKGTGLSIPVSPAGYSASVRSQKFSTMQSSGKPLVPKSSYYFGPPPPDSAYGTPPIGQIGVHHPREIIRVERDYTGGEVIQFAPIFPLELENRLTPTQFLESINTINEILISAYSLRFAFWDNLVTVATLQLSRLFTSTHFQKEMRRLRSAIEDLNVMLYNPVGLNILWPGDVAFLYLEIEYY